MRGLIELESVPVSYEVLRNLIVARMVEGGTKPDGMKRVVDRVLAG